MTGLDILMAYLEGAIEAQTLIAEKLKDESNSNDYEEGRLSALADVLEEAVFIKRNLMMRGHNESQG